MYNISQFKPCLYILLILGLMGFSLASQSIGTFVLGTIGILCNAWLVFVGRCSPLPRLLANVVTLGATVYVGQRIVLSGHTAVLVVGQFLVLLQLVKLWEQRANRDYAQLLVLSLLLMVAAAISTASLAFGVLLVAYLFLSLYCCLLFHLKVETDSAKAALALPEEKVSPETLRLDQRKLSSSMRRLTGFVSAVAVAMAVSVFLFFPRGTGAGLLGPLQFQAGQPLTGFSDQVGFQKIAQIQQNQEIMAYLQVWKNDQMVRGTQTLLLRGASLDRYTGDASRGGVPWQWMRNTPSGETFSVGKDQTHYFYAGEEPEERWRQHFSFRRPTGTPTLFALEGVVWVRPRTDLDGRFARHDGVLTSQSAIGRPLDYEVLSRGSLNTPGVAERIRQGLLRNVQRRHSVIDPKIVEYAQREEVSGSDATGPLAARRPVEATVHELDAAIAENIQQHLLSTFAYTLDLTDARKIIQGQDPMVAFLYDLKRGHCEYFAGAMALMCQGLGMQARMVTGFKVGADDYNEFSDQYVVRQAHAHAWVEVLTADGWKSFDPTSGREAAQGANAGGFWKKLKNLFNYMEFQYGNSVIAYDNENQENLIHNMESSMTRTAWRGAENFRLFREWIESNKAFWIFSSNALIGLVLLLALVPVGMGLWLLWDRFRLRRRAARIGLESLPPAEQFRLVRQLGFYDDLMRLLARHGITRPPHLTPLEFSQSLLYLPNAAYDTIVRLTELFYRVRFGRNQIKPGQAKKLHVAVAEVGNLLAGKK